MKGSLEFGCQLQFAKLSWVGDCGCLVTIYREDLARDFQRMLPVIG